MSDDKVANTDAKASSDCQWPHPDRVQDQDSFIPRRIAFGKRKSRLQVCRVPLEHLYEISPNGELSPSCLAKSMHFDDKYRFKAFPLTRPGVAKAKAHSQNIAHARTTSHLAPQSTSFNRPQFGAPIALA
jgi:hypothetical protein